ncbi:hypothetical protein TNCV_265871 [Trichonephila clavipes]|nr:hypothetical protein TNCV_265871 [Trichonephila clavipes]
MRPLRLFKNLLLRCPLHSEKISRDGRKKEKKRGERRKEKGGAGKGERESRRLKESRGERESGARLVWRKGLSPEIGVRKTMNAGFVENGI